MFVGLAVTNTGRLPSELADKTTCEASEGGNTINTIEGKRGGTAATEWAARWWR